MGFYGRIVAGSNQNLQFDKVYPNKFLMDNRAASDNIFIGRNFSYNKVSSLIAIVSLKLKIYFPVYLFYKLKIFKERLGN